METKLKDIFWLLELRKNSGIRVEDIIRNSAGTRPEKNNYPTYNGDCDGYCGQCDSDGGGYCLDCKDCD